MSTKLRDYCRESIENTNPYLIILHSDLTRVAALVFLTINVCLVLVTSLRSGLFVHTHIGVRETWTDEWGRAGESVSEAPLRNFGRRPYRRGKNGTSATGSF